MALRWRFLRSNDILRFIICYGRRILIPNTKHKRRGRFCCSLLYSGLSAEVDWRRALPPTLVTKTAILHDRTVLLPSIVGTEPYSSRRRFVFCRSDCATVDSHMLLHIRDLLAHSRSLCSVWIYPSLHGIPMLLRHYRNNGCDISPVISAKWTPYLPRAQPSTISSLPSSFLGKLLESLGRRVVAPHLFLPPHAPPAPRAICSFYRFGDMA